MPDGYYSFALFGSSWRPPAHAAGVYALFIECHPKPSEAWSDGATHLEPEKVEAMLREAAAIRGATRAI